MTTPVQQTSEPVVITNPLSQLSPDMFVSPSSEAQEKPGDGVEGKQGALLPEDSQTEDQEGQAEDQEEEQLEADSQEDSNHPFHIDLGYEEGNLYTVTLPNGNTLDLPEGAVITNKVGGKVQNYNLAEQMGIASGEIAVSKRLAEIKKKEETLLAEVETHKSRTQAVETTIDEFKTSLLESETPHKALELLADRFEIPLGSLFKSIVRAYKLMEQNIYRDRIAPELAKAGFNLNEEADIKKATAYAQGIYERAWEDMDREVRSKKERASQELSEKGKQEQSVMRAYAAQQLENYGLTVEEAKLGEEQFRKNNPEVEPKTIEEAKEIIRQSAILGFNVKKGRMIGKAIREVDSGLIEDTALIDKLLKLVDPRSHDHEDIVELVKSSSYKTSAGRRRTVLAKDLANNIKTSYATSNGATSKGPRKVVTDMSQIEKAYGFK